MMNTSLFTRLLSIIAVVQANYFQVLIREIDNVAGTTLDGTKCSNFDFLGLGCNSKLQAGVGVGNRNPALQDLGQINSHGESKISNLNFVLSPANIDDVTDITEFTVVLSLTSDSGLLDNVNFTIVTSDQRGVYTYTSQRPGTLGITYSIAWSTDLSAPATTSTPLSTVAQSSTTPQSTMPPTTTPKLPIDCDEIEGLESSGNYTIYPDGVTPVNVWCDKTQYGVYTTIQSRSSTGHIVNFNMSLSNFTEPFGFVGKSENYWFGLENMYQLTSMSGKQYALQIDVCCSGKLLSKQIYHNFKIGSSNATYKMIATADIPGIGLDYLSVKKDIGAPFSTVDTYNTNLKPDGCDELDYMSDDGDMAKPYGGWWFGSCGNNLNGAIVKQSDVNGTTCSITNFKDAQTLGVNLRLTSGTTQDGYDVDLVSFDRARMVLFTFDSLLVDKSDESFCK